MESELHDVVDVVSSVGNSFEDDRVLQVGCFLVLSKALEWTQIRLLFSDCSNMIVCLLTWTEKEGIQKQLDKTPKKCLIPLKVQPPMGVSNSLSLLFISLLFCQKSKRTFSNYNPVNQFRQAPKPIFLSLQQALVRKKTKKRR